MNTWSTLKDKLKQDQVLRLQMSEKFRQKCSQLEVNEILSPFTNFTGRYAERRRTILLCLVPRPQYYASVIRFGSRGPGRKVWPRRKSEK